VIRAQQLACVTASETVCACKYPQLSGPDTHTNPLNLLLDANFDYRELV